MSKSIIYHMTRIWGWYNTMYLNRYTTSGLQILITLWNNTLINAAYTRQNLDIFTQKKQLHKKFNHIW